MATCFADAATGLRRALAPTLVTASLLAAILTHYQLITLRDMGRNTADVIATQAASITAGPMQEMQRRDLIRIAQSIATLPHVTCKSVPQTARSWLTARAAPPPGRGTI